MDRIFRAAVCHECIGLTSHRLSEIKSHERRSPHLRRVGLRGVCLVTFYSCSPSSFLMYQLTQPINVPPPVQPSHAAPIACRVDHPVVFAILSFTSRGHDTRVDLWSLGCVVFEALVGENPFQRRRGDKMDRQALFDRIQRGRVEFPSSLSVSRPHPPRSRRFPPPNPVITSEHVCWLNFVYSFFVQALCLYIFKRFYAVYTPPYVPSLACGSK